MEILLNLLWLMLLAPALWLWRRRQISGQIAQAGQHYESARFLLCLGCILFLLFPVISATDDLLAVKAEVEEPGSSKRDVREASSNKVPSWHWHGRVGSSPAGLAEAAAAFVPEVETAVAPLHLLFLPTPPAASWPSRAPPCSRLA